jgi:hypothetical protein
MGSDVKTAWVDSMPTLQKRQFLPGLEGLKTDTADSTTGSDGWSFRNHVIIVITRQVNHFLLGGHLGVPLVQCLGSGWKDNTIVTLVTHPSFTHWLSIMSVVMFLAFNDLITQDTHDLLYR